MTVKGEKGETSPTIMKTNKKIKNCIESRCMKLQQNSSIPLTLSEQYTKTCAATATPRDIFCNNPDGFQQHWQYQACLQAKRSEPKTPFIVLAYNSLLNNPHPYNTHDSGGNRNPTRSRNEPCNTFLARNSIVEDNDELNEISQFLPQSADDKNQAEGEKRDENVDKLGKKKIHGILLRKLIESRLHYG